MSDEALVQQARDGDVPAFGRLVERDSPAVYRLCYAILRSHDDAEDAAQEVFVKVWRDLPQLREPGAWPSWLNRVAVRICVDIGRANARRARPLPPQPPISPDPAGVSARRQAVEAALQALSPEDRALLVLRFYLDRQLPQVASTLGIPLGTAKSRLHRVLHRLRPLMEGESER